MLNFLIFRKIQEIVNKTAYYMPRSEKQFVFYKHLHAKPWPEFCPKFCLGLFTGPERP